MVTTIPQLRKWADVLCENTIFLHSYATDQRTYGQRRAYIQDKLIETFGSDAYRCNIYDREQLRRYFDVLCSVKPDPKDATYDKYDGVLQMLPLPTLQPKKAKSIMDRNLIETRWTQGWTHVRCRWGSALADELRYFFDEVKRLADEHGDIRFVFGFDS
jgi:hypothetical protein